MSVPHVLALPALTCIFAPHPATIPLVTTKRRSQRRRRHTGSITEVDRQSHYRVRVDLGVDPATGRRRQLERTVRGSHQQAEAALRRLFAEAESQKMAPSNVTVADAMGEWLRYVEGAGLRPSTVATYATTVRVHVVPRLGRLLLGDVTPYVLDCYYRDLRDVPLAPGTIRYHHRVLSAAFRRFETWGWLTTNPVSQATPPRPAQSSRRAPSPAEVRAMLEAAEGNEDLRVALTLAALTGMRRGELCGLQWGDIDWHTGAVTLQRQRVVLEGGDQTGPLKTGRPRRFALSPLALDTLAGYRDFQHQRCADLGKPFDPAGWVLSLDGGSRPLAAKQLGTACAALSARIGAPIRLHELRHFAATQMLSAGVDVKTAAARLGHSPAMLLSTYAHVLPAHDTAAASVVEAALLGH